MFEKNSYHKVSFFRMFTFGLKISAKTAPIPFSLMIFFNIFNGLSFGLTTFALQYLFDSVSNAIDGNGTQGFVYLMIAGVVFIYIINNVLRGVNAYSTDILYGKLEGAMAKIINEKSSKIDPINYEDPSLYDDFVKAEAGSNALTRMANIGLMILTHYITYFIFMGFYLSNLKPQLVFALFCIFIPVAVGQFVRTGIIAKFEDKAAPLMREQSYYGSAITSNEYFKETRILGAYKFFFSRMMSTIKKLNKAEWKKNVKINLLNFCLSVLSAGGYVGVLYLLVTALLSEEISIGALAAVLSSISTIFVIMRTMVDSQIGSMTRDMGQARNFMRFVDMPVRGGKNSIANCNKGIVAEDISFIYPNTTKKSIENISLTIRSGETIAIVGENGSGKTTLVRLLIGLYKPQEGKVFLNGMDTATISEKSLFSEVSGVFQRYQRYQMTLEKNIKISDIESETIINNVLEQAGIDIDSNTFPEGIQTMLSREFGGVDLSGGQWQRIAIARGLYRIHNVIVLDEPTAAIDPIEESRIYQKFVDIAKNSTAIIVTHRLGSTKIADRIVVMEKGKIVDIGTHIELLQRGGMYTELYNTQAKWYDENGDHLIGES